MRFPIPVWIVLLFLFTFNAWAEDGVLDARGDEFAASRVSVDAQFVDAGDRVDRAFNQIGDLSFNLLGRRTRVHNRNGDGWQVDLRKQIDAERLVGKQPDHSQAEN